MMNYIIVLAAVAAFICAGITGNMSELSEGILEGAKNATRLCLSLLGAMCLWNGISELAEKSGLEKHIRRLLTPLIKTVFPKYGKSPAAPMIAANITANLLGLGNAATPLGIEAMRRMKEFSGESRADRETVRFVVLNSAALTLIPTTVAALRAANKSAEPFSVLPAVWATGITALAAGLTAEMLTSRKHRTGKKLSGRRKK